MTKLSLKRHLPIGIALGAVVLSVLIISSRPAPEQRPPERPPASSVAALSVATSSNRPRVETQGSVQVRHAVDLVSRVSGLIESVTPGFAAGHPFAQGDLLLRIEQQDFRNALVQAQAELANAEQLLAQERAQAEQARREWRDLGSAEANRLFLREPQLESALARHAAAQASVAQAELNLQRTEIRAPFDGQIENIAAGLGQYVSPGTPLASIRSTQELEVQVSLTAEQLRALGWSAWIGQSLENPTTASLNWMGAAGEAQAGGVLRSIGGVIQSNTQLYPVYIDLLAADNPKGLPVAGQFVNLVLEGVEKPDTLWVPRTALFERSKVLLVVDGLLQVEQIEVLAQTADQALVAGLQDGQVLVLQRPLWILPGQAVTPQFAAAP